MSDQNVSLSYQARRELLTRIAPRYQDASGAQKSLLLDEFVAFTGYARKAAIRLLNHPPGGDHRILRPRLPRYGPEVQRALFLAWKAARYICAKRLIPFLPTLIPTLERHGHLQLSKESCTHLLTMSVTTAERLLRTQRKPALRGLCITTAGPLLKHQIPIRTFTQWDDGRPGFLEADLVAHGGGHLEGSYLYTLTLTDIATGWTECLPLLFRCSQAVEATLQQARVLFPFPILGIDTDNGTEFINEEIVAYCEREHLTFTRGRPGVKNDQAHVEQKNGQIVRPFVGYDRLVGEQAYRQLRELYRAVRLYVNCFQPSMKRLAPDEEERPVRRVYNPAKTHCNACCFPGFFSQTDRPNCTRSPKPWIPWLCCLRLNICSTRSGAAGSDHWIPRLAQHRQACSGSPRIAVCRGRVLLPPWRQQRHLTPSLCHPARLSWTGLGAPETHLKRYGS